MGEDLENKNLSWCERILLVMENEKWYSHKMLHERLGLTWNENQKLIYCFGSYLTRLVKNGYLIRAHAPNQIQSYVIKVHYVYKKTGRKFRVKDDWHKYELELGRKRRIERRKRELLGD